MPELADERNERLRSVYHLSEYDASQLTDERTVAEYFEAAVAAGQPLAVGPKAIANWITGELFRLLHDGNQHIDDARVLPAHLVELIALQQSGVVTMSTAKQVLEAMFSTGRTAGDIVTSENRDQISDAGRLATVVDAVIVANPEPVKQYRGGKDTVLRHLLGQVMKATQGKADPVFAAQLLRQRLDG
jgi:aspartyl-tRNA(Asn)/glutamyl-tRNA(Gln) amidotransferase subunit B